MVRKRESPPKQFVWFENSAHFPMTEEPGKFLLFWYAPDDCGENWRYPVSIALSIDRIFFVLKTLIGARLRKHCSWRVTPVLAQPRTQIGPTGHIVGKQEISLSVRYASRPDTQHETTWWTANGCTEREPRPYRFSWMKRGPR